MSSLINRKQEKELETLCAENEALKESVKRKEMIMAQNENMWKKLAIEFADELREILGVSIDTHGTDQLAKEVRNLKQENEAKDAQIKALVEAINEVGLNECNCVDEDFLSFSDRTACDTCTLNQAISAIPAETVELYRLEREVVDAAINWKNFKGDEHNDPTVLKLYQSVTALEVHKEGKR